MEKVLDGGARILFIDHGNFEFVHWNQVVCYVSQFPSDAELDWVVLIEEQMDEIDCLKLLNELTDCPKSMDILDRKK